ncbi:FecCD family ABC transporter permease [Corynebacterium otitidis]|uniref:FecCD family ABC transporter permease n=1 Tax=Corynebacterium otitidis TaxID=29321 RepID=UPI0009E3FEBF|nr:iron ABC transporter permease [Corynebacterium otitidis]
MTTTTTAPDKTPAPRVVARRPQRLTRGPAVWVAASAALILAATVALGAGDYGLSPGRILATLTGHGEPLEELVVYQLRLPRLVLGLAVGAMLGISGAITQTTARNGLASPDLLGVTNGASAGAVAVIVLGGGTGGGLTSVLGGLGVTAAALIGGLASAALVGVLLYLTSGGALQVVLVGVGVSAFFSGLTSWLLVEASIDDAERASAWLMGSLGGGRSMTEATLALGALAVAVAILVPTARSLGALQLGRDQATALGYDVAKSSAAVLLAAVILASVAATVAGPIGFIALVAPHVSRLASGAPRAPLPLVAIVGAALVVGSDVVARLVIAPLTLPTGSVTALVGAPFLVWLLVRDRKAGS